ncbi:hypothetical protein QWJ26_05795 [Streptomyces sp. CSDS2]|uniref:hypothetical protein n=1 Tax=Streptomyces sp. CSDS2 TaxID=3055051 RepID=UPI0025B221EF|nr:hypothetical protein [Streptomyces sp. CSDS2]MDN3259332.1 hypothetical protein [Streptomyces sp. CSDS2]
MLLVAPGGVFAAVAAHVADPRFGDTALHVQCGPDQDPVSLTPVEAHQALYGDPADQAQVTAIWRDVIRAAQSDDTPDRRWQMLLLWLALPRLAGTARRITRRLGVGSQDSEGEMVATLLERLPTVDPESPDAIGQLLRAARSSAWNYARSEARSFPCADMETVAARHARPEADDTHENEENDVDRVEWEMAPPPGPAGLRASLRGTVSAAQVEGELLGALAKRLSLHDMVRRARHHNRRRRIGTLSLRPPRRRP